MTNLRGKNLIGSTERSKKQDQALADPDLCFGVDSAVRIAHTSDVTVLITGATGTGKSTLAKKIHDQSRRRDRPFVCINLATLHEGVLESELFGHEKGAFTGAIARRIGRLEAAQGGTLLLDEISELTPRLQARLLEFMQSRTFCRVGGNQQITLDVRVIAATHKNLTRAIQVGEFREDLFHRLRVVSIHLKSLREQPEALDVLIHEALRVAASEANRSIYRISREVADRLEEYPWPGNFRELKNVLSFAVLAAQGSEIGLGDLPHWMNSDSCDESESDFTPLSELGVAEVPLTLDYQKTMTEFEKVYLERALSRYHGRVTRTANTLGVSKTTLLRRIRTYGISLS